MTACVTLAPVWLGIILSLSQIDQTSFWDAVRLNTERGDLFILATAVIAPIILYVTVERGNLPSPFTIHFPGGWFFMLLSLFLLGASSILFSVKRIADVNQALPQNADFIYSASLYAYIISIIVALIVSFVKARIELSSADMFRSDDAAFLKLWGDRGKKDAS